MREKKPCAVVTFHTTAEAMAVEKACREKEIEGKLIPAPRVLSSDCGIAWKSPAQLRLKLEEMLEEEEIEHAGVYELEL